MNKFVELVSLSWASGAERAWRAETEYFFRSFGSPFIDFYNSREIIAYWWDPTKNLLFLYEMIFLSLVRLAQSAIGALAHVQQNPCLAKWKISNIYQKMVR